MHPRAAAILSFWLGDDILALSGGNASGTNSVAAYWQPERQKLWFFGGPDVDSQIITEFKGDLEAAVAGEYDAWGDPSSTDPLNTLAGIVLLDQFSRNVYRGTPQAFAQDSKALDWAQRLAAHDGIAAKWPLCCLAFIYLPYEHSESLEVQQRGLELFEAAARRAADEGASDEMVRAAEGLAQYSRMHRDVIQLWGRFPHRNAILGRKSTPEEVQGLADGTIKKF